MQNQINPYDKIELTKTIEAKVLVLFKDFSEIKIDVILPTGTSLSSNYANYFETNELNFHAINRDQISSIINIFNLGIYEANPEAHISYLIKPKELQGNFKTIEKFNYKKIMPSFIPDRYLMACLIIDGKTNEIDSSKLLCLSANFNDFETVNSHYDCGNYSLKEAIRYIVYGIKLHYN